uniref:NADH-ubiquinone oxidoreductase chain 3 n=1 Tax=Wallacidia oculata TaxID=590134 RepID=E0WBN9_9HYME|nr:NADH dehydrogenase subunit 3 [Wallacidia oculata]
MIQVIVMLIMWTIMYILKFKKNKTMKNMSPFECGYNTMSSKMPLSIQFTLLVFVFLLFDIELSILISSNWKIMNINKHWILTMSTF